MTGWQWSSQPCLKMFLSVVNVCRCKVSDPVLLQNKEKHSAFTTNHYCTDCLFSILVFCCKSGKGALHYLSVNVSCGEGVAHNADYSLITSHLCPEWQTEWKHCITQDQSQGLSQTYMFPGSFAFLCMACFNKASEWSTGTVLPKHALHGISHW